MSKATGFSSLKNFRMPMSPKYQNAQKPTGIKYRLVAAIPYVMVGSFMPEDSLRLYWLDNQRIPNFTGMTVVSRLSSSLVPTDGYDYPFLLPNCDSAYDFPGQPGGNIEKDIYAVNAVGNVTSDANYIFNGSNWSHYSQTDISYDNHQNRLETTHKEGLYNNTWANGE